MPTVDYKASGLESTSREENFFGFNKQAGWEKNMKMLSQRAGLLGKAEYFVCYCQTTSASRTEAL